MFASAGEKERVPVRTEGTEKEKRKKEEERKREKEKEEIGVSVKADRGDRGPEKDRRKNGEGYVAIKRMCVAPTPHLRLLLLRVYKVHLGRGQPRRFPKRGDL